MTPRRKRSKRKRRSRQRDARREEIIRRDEWWIKLGYPDGSVEAMTRMFCKAIEKVMPDFQK